ncbi:PA3371 family protein [Pseudomonas sp. Pseusp122]|uniref:PA3371 family protein n=1 Tax=unclassified Pseudomonas TaxID=196821 RepID=UPI0039A4E18A
MSKSALSFAILTAIAVMVSYLLSDQAPAIVTLSRIIAGVLFTLFILALIVGRRFKFDPVLR